MSSTDTETDANASAQSEAEQTYVPPPPRLTGDYHADQVILSDYLTDFYNAAVVQSGLLDPSFQADAGPFDPSNLPDPAATTIAAAQQVANVAYQYADAINKALGALGVQGFPITPPTPQSG